MRFTFKSFDALPASSSTCRGGEKPRKTLESPKELGLGAVLWGGGSRTHLGGEVLQDGGAVDGRGGTHSPVAGRAGLEMPVDAADRELEVGVVTPH